MGGSSIDGNPANRHLSTSFHLRMMMQLISDISVLYFNTLVGITMTGNDSLATLDLEIKNKSIDTTRHTPVETYHPYL